MNYDEAVVRELLVNALAHRPYTTRGDIFINLYPDRMEIHNPGLLPLGVTPINILHKTVQRNPLFAKLFLDLGLMEKEGSGYDKMYEILLSAGKPIPEVREQQDRVTVIVHNRITNKSILKFINDVHQEFQLNSKEIISLGLIAQHTALSAIEFSRILNLGDNQNDRIRDWLGRLLQFKIVKTRGKTKGMSYYVNHEYMRKYKYKGRTSLKGIENHRLRELILGDL